MQIGVSNLLMFRNYKNSNEFYLKRFCFLIKDKICKVSLIVFLLNDLLFNLILTPLKEALEFLLKSKFIK